MVCLRKASGSGSTLSKRILHRFNKFTAKQASPTTRYVTVNKLTQTVFTQDRVIPLIVPNDLGQGDVYLSEALEESFSTPPEYSTPEGKRISPRLTHGLYPDTLYLNSTDDDDTFESSDDDDDLFITDEDLVQADDTDKPWIPDHSDEQIATLYVQMATSVGVIWPGHEIIEAYHRDEPEGEEEVERFLMSWFTDNQLQSLPSFAREREYYSQLSEEWINSSSR